ncbi:uncharacterized protein G2W53_034664 [Senna tora]|uniref:F-box domain-containing protein n=1 Tax=Senna tora TaxID=362788 RepID=A0A834T1X4_9FABA|nr:uncharacterized protein G2W53_034664 [Senna tora]
MKQLDAAQSSLPQDVALKIASLLQVRDLCALACCSRFWRQICSSDCVWESLVTERWPSIASSSSSPSTHPPNSKEWRKLYIKKHNDVVVTATAVAKFVEESSPHKSLEVGDYLKAVQDLSAAKLGFKDVQMILFRPKLNVLTNLVGLHYCLTGLGITGDELKEALETSEISERHVCIKWWKLGRWFYGFRMRDESHSRWVSLANLATNDDDEHILGVLHRGAIYEVLRVQISSDDRTTTPWSTQTHG